jgi:Fur family transcriptional regulator, iron response regulator
MASRFLRLSQGAPILGPVMQKDLVHLNDLFREAGLRPTRQRLALADLLYKNGDRHVTAEKLHSETLQQGIKMSLATIYNNLHQFTAAKLLKEVVVDSGKSYFDTNMLDHHHFFIEDAGELVDIESNDLIVENLPPTPEGTSISGVDVIIRVTKN